MTHKKNIKYIFITILLVKLLTIATTQQEKNLQDPLKFDNKQNSIPSDGNRDQYSRQQKYILTQIEQPVYRTQKIGQKQFIIQDKQLLNLQFPFLTFQISSQLYMYPGTIQQSQLFNKSKYTKLPTESRSTTNRNQSLAYKFCKMYPTDLFTSIQTDVKFQAQFEFVDNVVGDYSSSIKKYPVYVLTNQYMLYYYLVDQINVKLVGTVALSPKSQQLIVEPIENSKLLQFNNQSSKSQLLLLTNQSVYLVDYKNAVNKVQKIEGDYVKIARIVEAGLINPIGTDDDKGLRFWVSYSFGIYIYRLQSTTSGKYAIRVDSTYDNITNDTIQSMLYEVKNKRFYLTASSRLMIVDLPSQFSLSSTPRVTQLKLESPCQKIKKINMTLYLVCRYRKISYLQQLLLEQEHDQFENQGILDRKNQYKITLNRYYGNEYLGGISDVAELGFGRVGIIGDQEMIVINEPVNRNNLIDLDKNSKEQTFYNIYSLGMISLTYLRQYSYADAQKLLVITEQGIQIVRILYQGPEVQCKDLNRMELGPVVSLLVVFNSTACSKDYDKYRKQPQKTGDKKANQNQDRDLNMMTICEQYHPIRVIIGQREMEEKTATAILASLLFFMIGLILACAGSGVFLKKKLDTLLEKLIKKLEAAKKLFKGKDSHKICLNEEVKQGSAAAEEELE